MLNLVHLNNVKTKNKFPRLNNTGVVYTHQYKKFKNGIDENLGPEPPHSVVWVVADRTVILINNVIKPLG